MAPSQARGYLRGMWKYDPGKIATFLAMGIGSIACGLTFPCIVPGPYHLDGGSLFLIVAGAFLLACGGALLWGNIRRA